MWKACIAILTSAVVVLFSSTSCEIDYHQESEHSETARVVFSVAEEKALSRSVVEYDPQKYTWVCSTEDETEPGTVVHLGPDGMSDPAGPFKTGRRKLTLTAYLDEEGKKPVYCGQCSAMLEEGINTVPLSVLPLMDGEGIVSLPERGGIVLADSSGSPINEYVEIITLKNMSDGSMMRYVDSKDREFRVPSGKYIVTVAYASSSDDGVEYGKESIMIPVYDWTKTRISGSLNENTGYVDFIVSEKE